MSKYLFVFLLYATWLPGFAAGYQLPIAIEFQEHGKFSGVIGKAEIEEQTIEVVTFVEHDGEVFTYPFFYAILKMEMISDGVYIVKCRNNLGVLFSGTIDLRDALKPKILITNDIGITLTNMSDEGRKMKAKFLPNLNFLSQP